MRIYINLSSPNFHKNVRVLTCFFGTQAASMLRPCSYGPRFVGWLVQLGSFVRSSLLL